jgi:GntR family transcriptional regulator
MPMTKYHQIYLVLREQLLEGKFALGVPGELALMQQFGVARVTVRRALEQLAAEGMILREAGRGTRPLDVNARLSSKASNAAKVVSASNPSNATNSSIASNAPAYAGLGDVGQRRRLTGLLENLVTMGLRTSVTVLEVDTVTASAQVASALQIAPGEQVQKAIRVRSTKEGPMSHITTYVPGHIARKFGRRELAKKPILMLLEEAGVTVGRAHQTISARLADVLVARHLDVAVGSALLAVRRVVFDAQERPIQWLHGLYRPDRYEYEMQLSRVGSIDAKVWVSKDISAQFS